MARGTAKGAAASEDEVERRVDALFDAAPGAFVRARDALARELSGAGDRRAGAVKALRRPTVLALALNRLARRAPAGLRRLLDAGERL
ncbi:MAG: hypothetical protein ACJ79R_09405, partial [Anaeromyxobacteraceae bacterium]